MKPKTDIDALVLARARRGDMQAHAELYRALAPSVYTLARRILVTAAAAEDVLQETFVEVIRGIDGFRGDARFATWVKRIAVNKCLGHLRSSWHSKRIDTHDVEALAPVESDGRAAEQSSLERALNDLPDTARAVVWLHDVEGYTHEEIGRMMNRSKSFSKSQLARAHERLRQSLDEFDEWSEASECVSALKTC